MERLFFILLIGFASVLLVHSWLLMNLSQKYNLIEERRLKKKSSMQSEKSRKQTTSKSKAKQQKYEQKDKGRMSR